MRSRGTAQELYEESETREDPREWKCKSPIACNSTSVSKHFVPGLAQTGTNSFPEIPIQYGNSSKTL